MTTAPTPDPGRPAGLRIGDAERNAAANALEQHLTSGRLTLDEYADRAARVATARTQDEVDEMFGDLPPLPGTAGTMVGSSAPTTGVTQPPRATPAGWAPSSTPVPRESSNSRALLIGLVAAMPFIALILFFITGLWYFFLLIPLVGAVFGPMIGSGNGNNDGGDDDDRDDGDQRGDRNRRRNR